MVSIRPNSRRNIRSEKGNLSLFAGNTFSRLAAALLAASDFEIESELVEIKLTKLDTIIEVFIYLFDQKI